jgi:hypothetical protein
VESYRTAWHKPGDAADAGFKSFETVQRTLASIELMHMLKKGQIGIERGTESLIPIAQFYGLAVYFPVKQA